MQIIRLIYTSVARPDLGYEELMQIRRTARVNNERRGLHGILCYGGGHFLQAIEGSRQVVNEVYHTITRDPRHSNLQILTCGPATKQSFDDWSMKLISWEDAYTAKRREVMLRHAHMATFDPTQMTAKQAHGFLRELAANERKAKLQKLALDALASTTAG
jgi:hypothetical protein